MRTVELFGRKLDLDRKSSIFLRVNMCLNSATNNNLTKWNI